MPTENERDELLSDDQLELWGVIDDVLAWADGENSSVTEIRDAILSSSWLAGQLKQARAEGRAEAECPTPSMHEACGRGICAMNHGHPGKCRV